MTTYILKLKKKIEVLLEIHFGAATILGADMLTDGPCFFMKGITSNMEHPVTDLVDSPPPGCVVMQMD